VTLKALNNIVFFEDEDPANLLIKVERADLENPFIVGSFIVFKAANGNQKHGVYIAGAKPTKEKRGVLKKPPVTIKAKPTETTILKKSITKNSTKETKE
jgi:hypothetical protein